MDHASWAVLSSQRSTYSLGEDVISDEGTQRVFAESIAGNLDIVLVDLEGVDLYPYVDVLGVSEELRDNSAILKRKQVQQISHKRVKSARGGNI
jgi:hypothetical protein